MLIFAAAYFFVFLLIWRSFRVKHSRAVGFRARLGEFLLALNWWILALVAIAYVLKPEQDFS